MQENNNIEDKRTLRRTLETIVREGVFLYLEERLSSPDEIFRTCMKEEHVYMADYVIDDLGQLKELRYNRIGDGL